MVNHMHQLKLPRSFLQKSLYHSQPHFERFQLIDFNKRTPKGQSTNSYNSKTTDKFIKLQVLTTLYKTIPKVIIFHFTNFYHFQIHVLSALFFCMKIFLTMCPLSTNDLHRIFQNLDKNGDGQVSLEELNWLLERTNVQFTLHDLETLVGKPSLGFNEFLFFYKSISMEHINGDDEGQDGNVSDKAGDKIDEDESDLFKAFSVFDLNGDGFISCEELESVLRRLGVLEENSGRDCTTMIRVYDTNLDGLLDFQEFKTMMFQNTVS